MNTFDVFVIKGFTVYNRQKLKLRKLERQSVIIKTRFRFRVVFLDYFL